MVPTKTFFNLNRDKQDRIMKAAVDTFANDYYSSVKLSDIIRSSKIPRGSFYQYFDDKKDIYVYMFDLIAQEKMKVLGGLVYNPEEVPFTELFYNLYLKGLEFAVENPKYVLITSNLLNDRSDLYEELFGDNLELAKNFYRSYIEDDKKVGRIREDIDTETLVDLVMDSVSSVAISEIRQGIELDVELMKSKIRNIIHILKKGIE